MTFKNDKQHSAALFELLIFALLKGSGFHIVPNPVMTGIKTPDFTLGESKEKVLLKCTLTGNALESLDENRKKGAVLQIIEELPSFPFYINVTFKKLSPHSISKKDFLKFLHAVKVENGHLSLRQQSAEYCYCGQSWGMVITITRKPHNAHTRTLGYCSQSAKTVDNYRVLMTSLNDKKGSKYKISNMPYIISVSVDDMSATEEDFAHVLFGPNYTERLFINERNNGFFQREGRPQNTSVSAVLFCDRLTVFGLMGSTLSLWHNPYATHKLTVGHFPFKEVVYQEDGHILHRVVVEKQANVSELLDIDKEKYKEGMWLKNRRPPPQ